MLSAPRISTTMPAGLTGRWIQDAFMDAEELPQIPPLTSAQREFKGVRYVSKAFLVLTKKAQLHPLYLE